MGAWRGCAKQHEEGSGASWEGAGQEGAGHGGETPEEALLAGRERERESVLLWDLAMARSSGGVVR